MQRPLLICSRLVPGHQQLIALFSIPPHPTRSPSSFMLYFQDTISIFKNTKIMEGITLCCVVIVRGTYQTSFEILNYSSAKHRSEEPRPCRGVLPQVAQAEDWLVGYPHLLGPVGHAHKDPPRTAARTHLVLLVLSLGHRLREGKGKETITKALCSSSLLEIIDTHFPISHYT